MLYYHTTTLAPRILSVPRRKREGGKDTGGKRQNPTRPAVPGNEKKNGKG